MDQIAITKELIDQHAKSSNEMCKYYCSRYVVTSINQILKIHLLRSFNKLLFWAQYNDYIIIN
jgi:hypothetical protein